MNRVKKGWENQAIGLMPWLLFLFLDNYLSYLTAFVVAVVVCIGGMFFFHLRRKDNMYAFMLMPSLLTFLLYSICLVFLPIQPVLQVNTPLIAEILLVIVLIFFHATQKGFLHHIRSSKMPASRRTYILTTLNEFYFVAQLFQNLYTLHLFMVIFYTILPENVQDVRWTRFLYRDSGIIIGLLVMVYEQIRLRLLQGRLRKEMWLPVLNDQGNVIGCIAYSVSRLLPKKYYHPVVRVVLLYKGMLYLVPRHPHAWVSASLLDYPFQRYVLFRQTIAATVRQALVKLKDCLPNVTPRLLVRYTFENEQVKQQVSLFVINLREEVQLELCKTENGKLWSVRQIEENLGAGIFSEYFEKEYAYLKNTILLAERLIPSQSTSIS
ncbi:hypothetical protein B5F77_12065 [Parabacteroides sp. An277]|uniref:hypothetical protein n=1 Tax=Parabacteroides sp. An277 TaxID=1965619 RepID=UPI000B36E2B6|nr:hypothetical protein [Parabacteroides sp. An277]OUO50724.1 hypothetical protein B5F77_12065 [Parabacteroides sp. An277]